MSSFLDELKSKHEAAIREEQAENSFYEKLLDQKEEILEKLFQCEIKNAVENIKKHFTYFFSRNPTADHETIEYRYTDKPGKCLLSDMVEVLNSYGCDFDFCSTWRGFLNQDDRERFCVLVKKMALCPPDEERVLFLHYGDDPDELNYEVFPPIFGDKIVSGFFKKVAEHRMTDFGKKYMESLKELAALEGISIEYKTTVSYPDQPYKGDSIFLIASIRV